MSDDREIRPALSESASGFTEHRKRMADLAERFERAGVRVRGWWWMEQGGPFTTEERLGPGIQGEEARPLVRADEVAALFTWEGVDDIRRAVAFAQEAAEAACGAGRKGTACDECQEAVDRYKARLDSIADRIAGLLPPREP